MPRGEFRAVAPVRAPLRESSSLTPAWVGLTGRPRGETVAVVVMHRLGWAMLAGAVAAALALPGGAAAAPTIKPKLGDWRGTQSGAPGVRNVALDVEGGRVSGYGLNLYPLSCENGTAHSRGITVPRSAYVSGWATEADLLDIGNAHLRISRRGRFTDGATFVRLFHVFPPYQIAYQLDGRFTSATTAVGTVRATVLEDTRGQDWLMPDFRPENVTRCSSEARWSACFQRTLGDRSRCLGTPEQAEEPSEPPSPPPASDPGDAVE